MLTNKILDPKITDTGIKENNINEKLILILFIFLFKHSTYYSFRFMDSVFILFYNFNKIKDSIKILISDSIKNN